MARDYLTARTSNARFAFEVYLRTGKIVSLSEDGIEVKFNPWHDPKDGRFTFAGQGTYFGGGGHRGFAGANIAADSQTRAFSKRVPAKPGKRDGIGTRSPTNRSVIFKPGGGSFGGGGAGGVWAEPSAQKAPKSKTRSSRPKANLSSSPPENKPARQASAPAPNKPSTRLIVRNGYNFEISAEANPIRRTEHVWGEWRLGKVSQRSRRAQAQAGGAERQQSDDGGHFVAVRFNGPHEWFNHFAQDSNFNRGVYRTIEDSWAKDIKAGNRVFVDIVPHYIGRSRRPYELTIIWMVNDKKYIKILPNSKQGK